MSEIKKKKLLVFHTKVAPYRVDFFNKLAEQYDMFLCMDRKFVYGGLYTDIEKTYLFQYREMRSANGKRATYNEIKKEINKHKPDIVMVSECGLISLSVIIYRWLHMGKFKVVSIIDDSYDQLTEGRQFTKRHVMAEKVMIPRFDQVINVDERVSTLFRERYGKGVSFPIIRDEIKYRNCLTSSLPISRKYIERYRLTGKKVVLYVGRFVKLKNIPSLINATRKVEEKNWKLVLVGAGDQEETIREMASGDDRIIMTGSLSGNALYAWYNIANVFVLASYQEAFGAVTNEALMAGCKCLISNRAGSSCLIEEGTNGYCFDPLNESEMVQKLQLLLRDTRQIEEKPEVRPCLMQTTFDKEIKKVIDAL